jgi:hypothetical protein
MSLGTNVDADAYLVDSASWLALTETAKDNHRSSASRLLNSFDWKGYITATAQVDSWPRTGVYDSERRYIASDSVPSDILNALYEMCGKLALGLSLYPDPNDRGVKVEIVRAGPAMSETQWHGTNPAMIAWPEIEVMFSQYLLRSNELLRA